MRKNTLKKALRYLEKRTPLRIDCGGLCGSCCCKGDAQTGMLLFAGEEERYRNRVGFQVIERESMSLLVCGGNCERSLRPLSCRFYPLFPLLYEADGREYIKAIFDPRALTDCPLLSERHHLDKRFCRAVERCGKLLAHNKKQAARLREISDLLLEIIQLNEMLG